MGNSTIGDFFIFVHEYSSISYKCRNLWDRNFREKIDATLVVILMFSDHTHNPKGFPASMS